jgi:hypothetical protein
MLASDRLLEIVQAYAAKVSRIVALELDDETLRLIIYLKDGTNLRVVEQWQGRQLERYSYYWLTTTNSLKVGWDNAPHHQRLESFPHHKHVGTQENRQPSYETALEAVMAVVLSRDETAV